MTSHRGDVPAPHPMLDRAQAQRMLADVKTRDPLEAVSELARWTQSVAAAPGLEPGARVERLCAIDAAAQPVLAALARDFLAPGRASRASQQPGWNAGQEYWRQAGDAFARALEQFERGDPATHGSENLLPELLVRTLYGLAQRIKWTYLRYGPVDLEAWAAFNHVYAFAESLGLAGVSAPAPADPSRESTPRGEFLAGAMLGAISPESLQPREIELAAQLIAEHARRFVLAPLPGPGLSYWTDLTQAMAPQRLMQPRSAAPGVRFFGAGEALHALSALARRVDAGGQMAPASAGLLAALANSDAVLPVLHHLAAHWTREPPRRKHARHSVRSQVSVVHGFAGVRAIVGERGTPDADAPKVETWEVANVSAGGFGASVAKGGGGDWLRVGTLLALQPAGASSWTLGVVRRLRETSPGELQVGIETLSKTPTVVRVRRAGGHELGVLVHGEAALGGDLRLVLSQGAWASGEAVEIELSGASRRYLPQGLDEAGRDYEVWYFREAAAR